MFAMSPLKQCEKIIRRAVSAAPGAVFIFMPLVIGFPPKRLFDRARLKLGMAMQRAGIDDGETLDKLLDLDGMEQTNAIKAKRNKLLRKLADAALQNDAPLPGAQAEFDRARALAL